MNAVVVLVGSLISLVTEIGLIFVAMTVFHIASESERLFWLWDILFILTIAACIFIAVLTVVSALWLATWFWQFLTKAVVV